MYSGAFLIKAINQFLQHAQLGPLISLLFQKTCGERGRQAADTIPEAFWTRVQMKRVAPQTPKNKSTS